MTRRLPMAAVLLWTILVSPRTVRATNPAVSHASTRPIVPQYWPTCPAIAPNMPMQSIGGWSQWATAVAWNGHEYGVAWTDQSASPFVVYFQRVYADGTPAAPRVQVSTTDSTWTPRLVWNATSYAIVFTALAGSGYGQVYFATLTVQPTGVVTASAPLKVSHVAVTETSDVQLPALAWSGNGYAVVWQEWAGATGYDVFATLLDANGNLAGTLADLVICDNAAGQFNPTVAWVNGANRFAIAWEDTRAGWQIYWNALAPLGYTNGSAGALLIASSLFTPKPSIAGSGSGFGLAWSDNRDAGMNGEIYFALFDAYGTPVTAETRLTTNDGFTTRPWLLWTGAEFEIFFLDTRTSGGSAGVWHQAVSSSGGLVGGNTLVSTAPGLGKPNAAFGRYGFLLTTGNWSGSADNFVQPLGCAADATPPSCPMNLIAYGVTGTKVSIAWIPSVEDATDVAYYEVYRDSAFLGRTSNPFYNDSGLALDITYNYYVRPVNAAQLVNGSCTNSLFVTSNASLILAVSKNDPNALLSWTDLSFAHYNVFRGTNPQSMGQITSTTSTTAQDSNGLSTPIDYYYSVDEPGW